MCFTMHNGLRGSNLVNINLYSFQKKLIASGLDTKTNNRQLLSTNNAQWFEGCYFNEIKFGW